MADEPWVAFLRAMNTGDRRLTNDRLCDAVATCGVDAPHAYQASGNVVFEDGRPRAEIVAALEEGLQQELGYPVPVFLRSGDEVRAIAASDPFDDEQLALTEGRRQVIFLRQLLAGDLVTEVVALAPDNDVLVPAGNEIHWLPEAGVGRSELDVGRLEQLTEGATIRTHGTIQRIAAKFL